MATATATRTMAEEPKVRMTFRARIAAKLRAAWNWVKRTVKSFGEFIARAARATASVVAKGARAGAHGVAVGLRYTGVGITTGLKYVGLGFTFTVRAIVNGVGLIYVGVLALLAGIVYVVSIPVITVLSVATKLGQAIGLVFALPHTLRTKGATKYVWLTWARSWKFDRSFWDYTPTIAFNRDLAGSLALATEEPSAFEEMTEGLFVHEYQMLNPDGSPMWDHETGEPVLEIPGTIVDENDEPTGEPFLTMQQEAAQRSSKKKGQQTPKQRPSRPRRLDARIAESN